MFRFYHADDRVANYQDAMAEYAMNVGNQNPDQAWILTDYDVWMPNPCYRGGPARHPEDDYFDPSDAKPMADAMEEDIPF